MRAILAVTFIIAFCTNIFSQTLVMPGDYPDPSVVKIGDTYWASATSSNWAPALPLLKSTDLVHWQAEGYVFPKLPTWADFYFWAPEITYENGKVYVYYAAHKKNGNLCVGVASADKPQGPYTDHGTLMCEAAGSIDAFPMRDENGKLYLVWKEDGNSIKQPTPIWAMEMNERRTALTGEKKELFRNDVSWEANLIEGVSMIRHGEYFYAFYAGAGCCGRGCNYAMGVARAKSLLGPWEKYQKNPLFTSNDTWKCPGHGTPVEKDGKYYLLYHAYDTKSTVYAGRQGVLKEFKFTNNGWIELVEGEGAGKSVQPAAMNKDGFSKAPLSIHWQWSVFQTPKYAIKKGRLELNALPDASGAFLGHRTFTTNYQGDVTVLRSSSTAESGLALIGDEKNLAAITVKADKLIVWKLESNKMTVVHEQALPSGDNVQLRAVVKNGKDISFSYSLDGKTYQQANELPVDGFYLPPWDRAVRIGLISKGESKTKACFDNFILENR